MPVTTVTTNDGISSARDFWAKIAVPDYEDFQSDPADLRKAFHAATSLYHVIDWVWSDYKREPQKVFDASKLTVLRDYLIKNECADFELIRDVADSSKHFRLDRLDATVRSSTDVTISSLGYGEARYGEGTYGGTPQVVVDVSGSPRHLYAIAKNVYQMWERLFRARAW